MIEYWYVYVSFRSEILVEFFYDRVHLNTLVYNKYERCEPFPEKNGFSRLGGGQN